MVLHEKFHYVPLLGGVPSGILVPFGRNRTSRYPGQHFWVCDTPDVSILHLQLQVETPALADPPTSDHDALDPQTVTS